MTAKKKPANSWLVREMQGMRNGMTREVTSQLVVSIKGTPKVPRSIPSFPTEHQQVKSPAKSK